MNDNGEWSGFDYGICWLMVGLGLGLMAALPKFCEYLVKH